MNTKDNHKVFSSIMILVGGAIGAGFLAIPYAVSRVGISIGLIQLLIVGIASALMCAYVAELVSRIKHQHQVVGLVGRSIGKYGKWLMTSAMFIGIYGAISAYGVGITTLSSGIFGLSYNYLLSILFIVAGLIIYHGLNAVDKAEVFSVSLLIPLLIISALGILPFVSAQNLSTVNIKNVFYPFGILLFACLSYQSIPEIAKLIKGKNYSKVIIGGTSIFMILYSLFAISFVGAYGSNVSEFAVESLSGGFGLIGRFVAILAMFTSFLILGLVIKDTYIEDYSLSKSKAFILTILPPFLLALFKPSFVDVLGFTGAITGGVVGILLGFSVYTLRKKQDRQETKQKLQNKKLFIVPGGNVTIAITTLIFVLGMLFEVMKYL